MSTEAYWTRVNVNNALAFGIAGQATPLRHNACAGNNWPFILGSLEKSEDNVNR
jgi:hypothetical protein